MSKLLYQPPLSGARAAIDWITELDHRTIFGMVWGPGYGMMFGNYGSLRLSSDGLNWTTVNSPVLKGMHVYAAVWAGTQWVICGHDTVTLSVNRGKVCTSPDGLNWTASTDFSSKVNSTFIPHVLLWDGVDCYVIPNNTSSNYYTYKSSDFITWTKVLSSGPPSKGFTPVGTVALWTGSRYVLGGTTTSGTASMSSATTMLGPWSTFALAPGYFYEIAFNGSVVVAVNNTGSSCIRYSLDHGVTWANTSPSFTVTFTSVTWTGSNFLAIGTSGIATSADGITWVRNAHGDSTIYTRCCWNGTSVSLTTGIYHATVTSDGLVTTTRGSAIARNVYSAGVNSSGITAVGSDLYVTSRAGKLTRSTDGGATWQMPHIDFASEELINGVHDYGSGLAILRPSYKGVTLSADGINWTRYPASGTFNFTAAYPPRSIANNGSVAIVVGGGSYGYIARTYDFVTWANSFSVANVVFNKVTWDGSQFFASAYSSGALCYTSPDGVTWTQRALPYAGPCYHVWTGTQYVMVIGARVVTSTTGLAGSWTLRATLVTPTAVSMNLCSNGRIVIGGNNSYMAYSDDGGNTWAVSNTVALSNLPVVGVVFDGAMYHAVLYLASNPMRATSTDMLSWTPTPMEYANFDSLHLQAGNTRLNSVFPSSLYLESDDYGKLWTAYNVAAGVSDVVYAAGRYVGVGANTYSYSLDKKTWLSHALYNGAVISGYTTVSYDGTTFKFAGNYGWNTANVDLPYAYYLDNPLGTNYAVKESNPYCPFDNYKPVGAYWFGNYHQYSSSGGSYYALFVNNASYTPAGTNNDQEWKDFTYGNGIYVAVGGLGNIVTTTDPTAAANWIKRPSFNTATIQRVEFGNGVFVAVGTGVCNYSYDNGATWQYAPFPSAELLVGMVWTGTKFVVVSTAGSVYSLVPPPP